MLDDQMKAIWRRYDSLVKPDGMLSKINAFQASCFINNISLVWITLIPLIFTQLAFSIALLKVIL